MIESILVEGLIYGIMVMGVFITFRVLDFPDLTVDGSFPLGAALMVQGLLLGMNGWLALLIWLSPLVVYWVQPKRVSANAFFLGAAIAAGLIGELIEFHFLGHLALALVLAAWLPFSLRLLAWLIAALAWMPALGWALAHLPNSALVAVRLVLALLGVLCLRPMAKTSSDQ